jgi:hypothetical protein
MIFLLDEESSPRILRELATLDGDPGSLAAPQCTPCLCHRDYLFWPSGKRCGAGHACLSPWGWMTLALLRFTHWQFWSTSFDRASLQRGSRPVRTAHSVPPRATRSLQGGAATSWSIGIPGSPQGCTQRKQSWGTVGDSGEPGVVPECGGRAKMGGGPSQM